MNIWERVEKITEFIIINSDIILLVSIKIELDPWIIYL